MAKAAKIFLYVIAILYICIGAGVVVPVGLIFVLAFLMLGGAYILVTPLPIISHVSDFSNMYSGTPQAQPLIMGISDFGWVMTLGLAAIILGLMALYSLSLMKRTGRGVYIWYFLAIFALVLSFYNYVSIGMIKDSRFVRAIPFNFIASFLYALAAYIFKKDILTKKNGNAETTNAVKRTY